MVWDTADEDFVVICDAMLNRADIDNKVWEYFWVCRPDAKGADMLVKQPAAVYVESVDAYENF